MTQALAFRTHPGRPAPRLMRFGKPGHFFDIDRDNEHRGLWRAKVQAVHQFGLATFAGLRGEDGASSISNIAKGRFNEYMIRVDGNDPANVPAGRANPQFYRSTNGGNNWRLIESVGNGEDMVVAIDWDPMIENRVYAGTDGGKIYCSDDGGQQWEPVPVRLSRGSKMSRSPSPSRLMPSTVVKMHRPGNRASHHEVLI